MADDKKAFVFGIFLGLLVGIGFTFFYCRFQEQKAIATVALEQEETKQQLKNSIEILSFFNQQQEETIGKLSFSLNRISLVANEEAVTVQQALGIISRLKELLKELP